MNILVVSDTHGNQRPLRDIISSRGPFDCLIHLGDGVKDGIDVARTSGLPFHGVCGNEDFGVPFPDTLRLVFSSWTFFMMHGHRMDISAYQSSRVWEGHLANMADLARKEDAQVFLFGHTHHPLLAEVDGTVIVNPGDQYIGSSTPPSFAVVELLPDTLRLKILQRKQNEDWSTLISHEVYRLGGNAVGAGAKA